jgi:hypothetical protein
MSNVIQFRPKQQEKNDGRRPIGDIIDEMDKYGMEISQMNAIIKKCQSNNQSIIDVCLNLIAIMQDNVKKPKTMPYDLTRELNVLAYVLEKGLRRSRL